MRLISSNFLSLSEIQKVYPCLPWDLCSVKEHIMNKCSRDSLSCLQNVELARPILQRKEFVVKCLFRILYWNSLDLVSIRTLKGNL